MFRYLFFLCFSVLFLACNNDTKKQPNQAPLQIRLLKDPQRINPFFSPTSVGREVFQYVFLPLADFHPKTLKLSPILIKEIPEGRMVLHNQDSLMAFEIEFLQDAVWADGTDISAYDYKFTVNAIKHPESKINAWKPYFEFFKDVIIDAENDKRFTVLLDPSYFLAKEICLTTYLFPAHHFDPDNVFKSINISQEYLNPIDSQQMNVIEALNNSMNHKKEIVQCGPYFIEDFQTNEYYLLKEKQNYWGDNYPDRPALNSKISQLLLRIVPDEVSAITMARDGSLDFLESKNAQSFTELRNEESFADKFRFEVPQITQYYFITLNNRSPILSDKRVRRALAHLVDVEDMIESIDQGLGNRTIGPFHQTKDYYNKTLKPISYDPKKSQDLLKDAGWIDSDNDGVRDKLINGNREQLSLDLLITGSSLSRGLALLMQETAQDVGVKINIVAKKTALIRKENLSNYNYDMFASAKTLDAAPDDPYPSWHSDNVKTNGTNIAGFKNEQADRLIERIRNTNNSKQQLADYLALQAILYEEQPVIFLYNPVKKFIVNKDLDGFTSAKRPGYSANTFNWKE